MNSAAKEIQRDKQRSKHFYYENSEHYVDKLRTGAQSPGRNSAKDEAPPRPPRLFSTVSPATDKANAATGNNEDAEQDDDYEHLDSVMSPATKGGRLKRYHSEPTSLTHPVQTDGYYSKISDSAVFADVYASDAQIQNEVKGLLKEYKWSCLYTERQKAEALLSDSETPDGSFAVICENIEENHHFPFTLLLKYKEKVTRTPIRKIQDFAGRTKYELFNAKKDRIYKLIQCFRIKPLPYFKIKLRKDDSAECNYADSIEQFDQQR